MLKHPFFILLVACLLGPSTAFAEKGFAQWPAEEKVKWTNMGGALFIAAWGAATWDYGSQEPHIYADGWFGRSDPHGGADKLGHFYSGYAMTQGLAHLYTRWGYAPAPANRLAALSSLGLLSFMEFGDAFSPLGFSRQDFLMNVLGTATGYARFAHPALARRLDIRLEYIPASQTDVFTDYERMKFLLAFKLEGFRAIRNPYLQYLELHLGYYTRHYEGAHADRQRTLYVALGVNLSRWFRQAGHRKTAAFLNYYQLPYSYVPYDRRLDD